MNKNNRSVKPQKRCTMCNKIFDEWDLQEDFSYQKWIGYGSVHDTEYLDIQLCCNCFDKILAFILKNSVNDPLTDYDFEISPNGKARRYLVDKQGNRIEK